MGLTQQKGEDWKLTQQLGCSEQESEVLNSGKETQKREVKSRGLTPDNTPSFGLVRC